MEFHVVRVDYLTARFAINEHDKFAYAYCPKALTHTLPIIFREPAEEEISMSWPTELVSTHFTKMQ